MVLVTFQPKLMTSVQLGTIGDDGPNGGARTWEKPCPGRKVMNEPININEASFEKAVLQSPVPTVVDFWAAWCGPCKMIAPVLDEIARESGDRFRVTKVNVDDEPALQQRFNVHGIPTLLFFSDHQVRDQIVGVVPKKAIVEKLESLLSSPVQK
jgi:thioredoxin